MAKGRIYLQPLGKIESEVTDRVADAVEETFGLPVVEDEPVEVPKRAFSASRNQYHSTMLLEALLRHVPGDALRVLGMTAVDLFVPQLNFVFGEATVDGQVGVISLKRLQPEFYYRPSDHELLVERAVKEAVHELGHTFGMRHCRDPRCVMFFSNNIEDTDHKSSRFCGDHAHQLALTLRPLRAAA